MARLIASKDEKEAEEKQRQGEAHKLIFDVVSPIGCTVPWSVPDAAALFSEPASTASVAPSGTWLCFSSICSAWR